MMVNKKQLRLSNASDDLSIQYCARIVPASSFIGGAAPLAVLPDKEAVSTI